MLLRRVAGVVLVLVLTASAGESVAQVTIGATASVPGTFGPTEGNESWAVGQTFRTPDGVHRLLEAFTLGIGGSPVPYTARLQRFDPGSETLFEDVLFEQSGVLSVPRPPSGLVTTLTTFDLGGIELSSRNSYVFYVSTTNPDGLLLLNGAPDVYPGGTTVAWVTRNLEAPSYMISSPWADVAFSATFAASTSVAPEPATWALLGTGLLGVLAMSVRRQRRRLG
jgi:hypothetical protein